MEKYIDDNSARNALKKCIEIAKETDLLNMTMNEINAEIEAVRKEQKINSFTEKVVQVIKSIPEGKVATYGQIAAVAGNPRAARQVVRVLNSCSKKYNLPWHRVINSKGHISLPEGGGFEEQKMRLEQEDINMDENGRINLKIYLWNPVI